MAFNLIVPPPKVKTGCFRISTVRLRGGPHKVQISIPSTMFTLLFKDAEKFDLLLGDGSDKGKLLIKPTTDGHFKPTFMKHAVLFRLPETEWTPQIDLSYDDPERREVQGGGLGRHPPKLACRRRQVEGNRQRSGAGRSRARDAAEGHC